MQILKFHLHALLSKFYSSVSPSCGLVQLIDINHSIVTKTLANQKTKHVTQLGTTTRLGNKEKRSRERVREANVADVLRTPTSSEHREKRAKQIKPVPDLTEKETKL